MKNIKISRKLDSLGRITLPKGFRKDLEIKYGDEVEFYTEEDKIILKRKYYKCCQKCNNSLIKKHDKFCNICGTKI